MFSWSLCAIPIACSAGSVGTVGRQRAAAVIVVVVIIAVVVVVVVATIDHAQESKGRQKRVGRR